MPCQISVQSFDVQVDSGSRIISDSLAIASFGMPPGFAAIGLAFADFGMKGVGIAIQALFNRPLTRLLIF